MSTYLEKIYKEKTEKYNNLQKEIQKIYKENPNLNGYWESNTTLYKTVIDMFLLSYEIVEIEKDLNGSLNNSKIKESKSKLIKIGSGWKNRSGGYSIKFSILPKQNTIVIFPNATKKHSSHPDVYVWENSQPL